MIRRLLAPLALLAAVAAVPLAGAAQEADQDAQEPEVEQGSGAVLRGLDKLNGTVTDLDIPNSSSADLGYLRLEVATCRYPAGNPAGDAYAFVTMHVIGEDRPLFEGWLIASSPALNALDHPRYDVWVLRCKT